MRANTHKHFRVYKRNKHNDVTYLAKHAVRVADAIPPGGQVERCHGVEKARSQTAQATVAQCGVSLLLLQALQVVSELTQCLPVGVLDVHVVEGVEEGAAHQKLHGQVVDTLGVDLPVWAEW